VDVKKLEDIKKIVGEMSLEEKCSMLSGKSFWETRDIKRLGIPATFLADGPHGIRKQLGEGDHLGLNESIKATCFPTAATMANSFDIDLGKRVGEALGAEAVCQKVNMLLGPGLNIKRNPLCGRNFEYFSEDPYLAGKMAASYVSGIQSKGVSACLKHFAANNQEHRRMVVDAAVDERALREIYLTNFEIAVKEGGSKAVMSAYNKINGVYANESAHLLRDILRTEWGFNGVIVSDWGGQNDRVAAVRAGSELEMPTSNGETSREVYEAVKSGTLDEKLVDELIERLLIYVFDTEKVFEDAKSSGEKPSFDKDAHHKLALEAAEGSIVLLKNTGSALPLKSKERVCIVGDFARKPRYQGAGSSGVNPTRVDNTLELIKDYDLDYAGFEPGFKRFGKRDKGLIKKAVSLASKADTVLVYLGLDEATEIEGLDRKSMALPLNQQELLAALRATGKKIVAVLSCGAAVETGFSANCDAIIHGYLGGQAGAGAMLNVLTGKVNPSGKLAETYPVKYSDCPSASNFPGERCNVQYRESIFAGYRYYDTARVKVAYPFGFGLSYTNFAYDELKINDKSVSFSLPTIGDTAGAEVCQLSIGLPESKIFRAGKELKGFKKIFLKPGEKKTVEIPFDEYSFRYFNVKTNKWETEAGRYDIMIGVSSGDIRLTGALEKKGTTDVLPYGQELPSYDKGIACNVSEKEFEAVYGGPPPPSQYPFYAYKRMLADMNTAICDLRFSRGWFGRFFGAVSKKFFILGMEQMPLRGLVRFGGMISTGQLEGLRRVFNGGTRPAFTKFLSIFFGCCSLGILGIPWLLWDLRKFFAEGKVRKFEGRLQNLKNRGAHEFEIWKAEKKIGKLRKKGASAADKIADLKARIAAWEEVKATKEQIADCEASLSKAKAKVAKIDGSYNKWQAKFDAKTAKKKAKAEAKNK
jgi:beta-glucosidase